MIKFGTSGFRAKIGEDFTKENTQKIAQALSILINKEKSTKPVIIGFDRRFMSDYFAKWFAEVLTGNKIHVCMCPHPIPTPQVMFGVKNLELDYGVTITASHNPYVYNGIKICVKGGSDAQNELTSKIEKLSNKHLRIKSLDYDKARNLNLINEFDNTKEYLKNIEKFVSKNFKGNKTKILFDCMYGVTAEPAKLFAKMFKLENFDIINDKVDPCFGNILPCPNESCLSEFKNQVVKGKYKIGLACDADGDRLGIIDEKGEYFSNNVIIPIIYYYLVKYRNMTGDVVRNMSTSHLSDMLAEKFGYKCHETNVGFKYVSAKMKETNALIGGESSGGFTARNYTPAKDSMFEVAMFLDAVLTINKPISKIVEEVKDFAGYISTYVEGNTIVNNKQKFLKIIKTKQPKFAYKPIEVKFGDGVKYIFEGGNWVHIRFSGTENLLRYHVEFTTEIECERNTKAILNFVNDINNNKKIK